jgi:hypothetical protein
MPKFRGEGFLGQLYKNPELPAPTEWGVVSRAIHLGVEEGA